MRTALTMPAVTVPVSPRGLPMATASWPTLTDEAGANRAATSSAASGSTRTTATSWAEDPPTTSPSMLMPSERMILTVLTPSTTWWLVTMYPFSASHTMPEPRPNLTSDPTSDPTPDPTCTSTTEGLTAAATATTGSSATAGAGYCGEAVGESGSGEASAKPRRPLLGGQGLLGLRSVGE